MERTFVMIKPDGVQRGLIANVIGAIEEKGYKLVGLKLLQLTSDKAAEHYIEHKGKPFYDSLLAYITSGPVVAMAWEGPDAVKGIRTLMGATNPLEAAPGSIRGRYALSIGKNIVHGSDSVQSAEREIGLYFSPKELVGYDRGTDKWL